MPDRRADGAWQLSAPELASGFATGLDRPPLQRAAEGRGARAAFEEVLLDALHHPPCVISFSGGRDSSAILAVAAHLARREGLPVPVPVTLRFARVPTSEEDTWQQHVVTRLRLGDWEVVEVTDELDLIGPEARALIARCGVLWPANTHFHAPIAARAAGGTLVTGFGGDEVMSPGWVWDRVGWVLGRRVRPRPSDVALLALASSPTPVRNAWTRRRRDRTPPCAWLTPEGARWSARSWSRLHESEAVRHDEALRGTWWSSRYLSVTTQSLGLMAGVHGARILHPFTDPRFLSALATERGRAGPTSRDGAMRSLFSDVLPVEVLTRLGKATFNGAFWGEETRNFLESWDGSSLDARWVDAAALQAEWRELNPDARTYPLLQAAWATASGLEELNARNTTPAAIDGATMPPLDQPEETLWT